MSGIKRKVLVWGWETLYQKTPDGYDYVARFYALLQRGYVYRWNTEISLRELDRIRSVRERIVKGEEINSDYWSYYSREVPANWKLISGGSFITAHGKRNYETNKDYIQRFRVTT